jgi:prepilin-type N-terminal cleavage/methylation domain-containing protein
MKNLKPNIGAAFTLIELLGVMAIIGILSAVLLPPLISKIEDANSTKEDANLEEIARALVAGIKASGRIPRPDVDPTNAFGWAAMATNYSVLGANELIRSIPSSTNDTVRRYFLSPALTNFFLSANYAAPAGGWFTNNFTNGPLYLMLVSVSKDGLLFGNGCTTNNNMASNNVLFLQNWAKTNNSAGRVEVNNLDIVGSIAGSSDRWTNRGEFLHVKVVDVKSLFCKITLFDTASPLTASITTTASGFTNSKIEWRNDLGIVVETSVDGTNYLTCENGDHIFTPRM